MGFEKLTLLAALALSILTMPSGADAAEKGKPVIKTAPDNAARAKQETEQAVQAYRAGDFQKAATHFKRVVKLDPPNAKAWLFLGQSLAQANDNMGARRAFAQVLALQSAGPVADRARDQFARLPEPDLFAMQLDSGLTLGDWLPLATHQGERDAVLGEIGQYLKQFGPVPQLLDLQEKLQQEARAEQEQRLKKAIADLKINDAETAKATLPQIRQLKAQAPGSSALLQLEAKACHLMQDFACAEAAYSAWLKTASGNDPKRKQMAAWLMQAKQHELLTVLDAAGDIFRDCPECPDMVVIPAGSFDMGSPNSETGRNDNEGPVHRVTIGKLFAIGKTEVTQGQWKAIMGNNSSNFGNCGDTCPVEQVSWDEAQEFIRKLSQKTGKQYRLPSEAEWEYACRAGERQKYCGSDNLGSVGWYYGNSGSKINPVAQKQANAFGLYDMTGNVWEWVEDSYHDNYNGAPSDGAAWQGGGAKRALRGGSWSNGPQFVRAAIRNYSELALGSNNFGFRLARVLP